MSFEHVGDAGGSVVVLSSKLREEDLSLVVQGSIIAKLRRAKVRSSTLLFPRARRTFASVGDEAQDGIRVVGTKLLRQAKQSMRLKVVGPQRRQEAVLCVLHISKGFAFPSFMDNATVGAAAKRAGPISQPKVPEPLASRAHSEALS